MLIPVSHGQIHVHDVCAGTAPRTADLPPTLLLHGFTGSTEAWPAPLIAELSMERRVLVVDLPGHGASDRSHEPQRYQMDRLVTDLVAVLDHLGIERADWVGYSMGGRVALAAAASEPTRMRRLVLESASPGLVTEAEREERRQRDGALASTLEEGDFEEFVTSWMALPLFEGQRRLGPTWLARERTRRLANDPLALAACLVGSGTGTQAPLWDALVSVDRPVLLVTGAADPKFTRIANAMVAELPRARHCIVRGAGHAVHVEDTQAWLREVRAFLDGP